MVKPDSSIDATLDELGLASLSLSEKEQQQLSLWRESHQRLFEQAQAKDHTKDPMHTLLGVTTYSYHEQLTILTENRQALSSMQQVLIESVGTNHANKFEAQQITLFTVTVKLWMALHGKLNLDFSLTNDHALQTAQLLAEFDSRGVDQIRCELLACYYAVNGVKVPDHSHIDIRRIIQAFTRWIKSKR